MSRVGVERNVRAAETALFKAADVHEQQRDIGASVLSLLQNGTLERHGGLR